MEKIYIRVLDPLEGVNVDAFYDAPRIPAVGESIEFNVEDGSFTAHVERVGFKRVDPTTLNATVDVRRGGS